MELLRQSWVYSGPTIRISRYRQAPITIIRKASTTMSDKLREEENKSYDPSPKQYHNNLKIIASLLPRARDHPRITVLTNPKTKILYTNPKNAIDIISTRYLKNKKE